MKGFPLAPQKGIMDKRILELALEALEQRKADLDAEIEEIRAKMRDTNKPGTSDAVAAGVAVRKPRTAAQRQAHSKRMKVVWAKRKAEAAKVQAAKKTKAPKSEKLTA
jgi:hypothetical protein